MKEGDRESCTVCIGQLSSGLVFGVPGLPPPTPPFLLLVAPSAMGSRPPLLARLAASLASVAALAVRVPPLAEGQQSGAVVPEVGGTGSGASGAVGGGSGSGSTETVPVGVASPEEQPVAPCSQPVLPGRPLLHSCIIALEALLVLLNRLVTDVQAVTTSPAHALVAFG